MGVKFSLFYPIKLTRQSNKYFLANIGFRNYYLYNVANVNRNTHCGFNCL